MGLTNNNFHYLSFYLREESTADQLKVAWTEADFVNTLFQLYQEKSPWYTYSFNQMLALLNVTAQDATAEKLLHHHIKSYILLHTLYLDVANELNVDIDSWEIPLYVQAHIHCTKERRNLLYLAYEILLLSQAGAYNGLLTACEKEFYELLSQAVENHLQAQDINYSCLIERKTKADIQSIIKNYPKIGIVTS